MLGVGTGQGADLAVPPGQDELIAYGPLLSDDETTWLGTAALIRAPGPDTARAILTPDWYAGIEVHIHQQATRHTTSEYLPLNGAQGSVSLEHPAAIPAVPMAA